MPFDCALLGSRPLKGSRLSPPLYRAHPYPNVRLVLLDSATASYRYDYWPTRMGPDSSGVDEEMYTLEASYPPVDPFEDDLDNSEPSPSPLPQSESE